jgi:hypothetical protein
MTEPSDKCVVDAAAGPLAGPHRARTANCFWCGRPFTPRRTGGSAQKFCSTGHRNAFWLGARRWAMRAVEAGLISVEVLKAP